MSKSQHHHANFAYLNWDPLSLRIHLGTSNLYMILYRNLTTTSCVMFTTVIAFIHLVKVSIAINKNMNPLSALGRAPTMSIPQIAKGQERLIGQRGFCMLRGLLLEELTVPALSDYLHHVILSCGPVESMFECFAYDRAPWWVWSTYAIVNILKQLNAFLSWDTLHHHAVGAPSK
jgi:hypothetical protein